MTKRDRLVMSASRHSKVEDDFGVGKEAAAHFLKVRHKFSRPSVALQGGDPVRHRAFAPFL